MCAQSPYVLTNQISKAFIWNAGQIVDGLRSDPGGDNQWADRRLKSRPVLARNSHNSTADATLSARNSPRQINLGECRRVNWVHKDGTLGAALLFELAAFAQKESECSTLPHSWTWFRFPSPAPELFETINLAGPWLERYVQGMDPYDLQKLVAPTASNGHHVSWNALPEPDKGIDSIAHNDPLGTSAPRIKVQVKRRADKITVDGLRAFIAILAEQGVGIFVSTGVHERS